MPRNKPALFRSPVLPGCFKKFPCECRFNTVYPGSIRCLPAALRCGPDGPQCPHRSNAGTENRDSMNEALSKFKQKPVLYIMLNKYFFVSNSVRSGIKNRAVWEIKDLYIN